MKLKEVTMEEAITSPELNLGKCYMLVEIENETTILELQRAAGFFLDKEEEIIIDDADKMIESFKKKAESLKARLEALEVRDKAIMDTSSMIDETIKNSLIEPDYFPEFEEELSEELTEEPEPERTIEEPEPVQKEETKEDKKKETKTKYDIPKVQALINAGWSNQQLAVEFGVTKEQMSKNLYNWRKSGKIK